jgi:hypothetical protein
MNQILYCPTCDREFELAIGIKIELAVCLKCRTLLFVGSRKRYLANLGVGVK